MKTKLFITSLVFMAFTAAVSAQQSSSNQQVQGNGKCKQRTYVDANKNGVCDNFENKNANCKGGKGQGNGMSCGHGKGQGNCNGQGKGNGKNFVDADKNGVCDNFEAKNKK